MNDSQCMNGDSCHSGSPLWLCWGRNVAYHIYSPRQLMDRNSHPYLQKGNWDSKEAHIAEPVLDSERLILKLCLIMGSPASSSSQGPSKPLGGSGFPCRVGEVSFFMIPNQWGAPNLFGRCSRSYKHSPCSHETYKLDSLMVQRQLQCKIVTIY